MSEVNNEKGVMAFLKQMRNGELGLAKTFWLYGVVASIVLQMIFMFSLLFVIPAFIVGPLMIYYVILNLLGVWKASDGYQGPGVWAILAKIFVALNIVMIAITIITIVAGAGAAGFAIFG